MLTLPADLIEIRLKNLTPSDDLIYEVLEAYGLPKSSITRLRNGELNKAKDSGSILWKNKLYYTKVLPALWMDTAAAVRKSDSILKLKPRFFIVSNGSSWLAYDSKTEQTREIELTELYKHHDFFLPWAGIEKASITLDTPADIRAAQRMGKLFDALRRDNPTMPPHDLNVFMARLLFCLFAEDSSIFESKDLFTNFIASVSQEDGSDLQGILKRLFAVMNTPMDAPSRSELPEIYKPFPYVNGGLFAHQTAIPVFSPKSRTAIIEAGALDWEEINTDIFGNMFQACLDQEKRKTLGEHYTSVPNIMKVLRPLFLDELEEAAEKAKGDKKAVDKLLKRMVNMRFFDPACGSGNFLLIAFKEMRRIEMELLESVQEETGIVWVPSIEIEQFYGIEIDDFAHEIATLSMWLVEHQMNQEFTERFGKHVPTLPLKKNENIVYGNSLRVDWNRVCPKEDKRAAPIFTVNELLADAYQKKFFEVYVFGNPPYAGKNKQSPSQKDDVDSVFKNWKNYRSLDYISCWFKLAVDYLRGGAVKIGLVSTNSVIQGEHVSRLWPYILKEARINFAYSSFKWANNAKYNAGVTCVIVGLENHVASNKEAIFFSNEAKIACKNISPYILPYETEIVFPVGKSISSLPHISFGNMPYDGGNLIIEADEFDKLDITNEVLAKCIRPILGSQELIRGERRYCLWLAGVPRKEWEQNAYVSGRVESCRLYRLTVKDSAGKKLAATPYLFREQNIGNAIIVPSVSSERRTYIPMGYVDSNTVISNAAFAIYDAEPWVFAIISSAMHMAWIRTTCGRLESRYRYSAKLCYNTFPVKKLSEAEKEMLNNAAIDVLMTRQKHTEMTLGDMYQPDKMPDDLKQAHLRMDALVDSLYRKKPFNSDEERLECLFSLYKDMTR